MKPRAFISFQVEDKWAREFLVEHANQRDNDIEFYDYSLHEPFDSKWKTNCSARIAETKGTIVLIGKGTHNSDAVLWEIEETKRQGHYLFGIQIYSKETYIIPSGLPSKNVIRWDFDDIVGALKLWK